MNEINIRLLTGEILSELDYHVSSGEKPDHPLSSSNIDWKMRHAIADLVMAVLARHDGMVLVNDEDLPVKPLPYRQVDK